MYASACVNKPASNYTYEIVMLKNTFFNVCVRVYHAHLSCTRSPQAPSYVRTCTHKCVYDQSFLLDSVFNFPPLKCRCKHINAHVANTHNLTQKYGSISCKLHTLSHTGQAYLTFKFLSINSGGFGWIE